MAQEQHILTFGPFRLDPVRACVWHGEQALTLRPRTFAMLRYLAEHPNRLVTKAELRQHVWVGTHVTDTVLRVCLREIRAALQDAAAASQYVQTVSGQGYRLCVPERESPQPPAGAGPMVGRQSEVDTLATWLQRAASGERQFVFLSGEAGIGKTTVLDLWLAPLAAGSTVRVGRGQCAEFYGEGEPYLPLLDALGQLGRGPQGSEILRVLRRCAPLWLVQLPGLIGEADLERLQRQVQGVTQTRMVRELAEVLEVLTADHPLVLVLEDLHWSDRSTVEVLAYLAQRREPARLLVLGTYRPVDVVLRAHPLRSMVQELCGRGQGVDLRLELLPATDVAAYVAGRLGGPVATALAAFVHERTEGNALFMVNIVEHLVQQDLVERRAGQWTLREQPAVASLPEGVRQLLVRRIESLAPDARRLLETASVVGEAFAVAAVATAAQCPLEDAEAVCEALAAQRHFLDDTGLAVWPNGTRSGSYRFQHALYRQVLYEGLGTMRCVQLHQHIGARLEGGYGAQVGEIAAQLAVHFERGGEGLRAVHYLQQMGEQAAWRNAYHEAIAALTKGLALLATLPDSPECRQRELMLRLALCEPLVAVKGWGSPEAQETYTRAYVLSQQVGETPQLLRALYGAIRFHSAQGQLRTAGEMSQQILPLIHHQPDLVLTLEGHIVLGFLAFQRGDFLTARAHLERSWRLFDTPQASIPTFYWGFVLRVTPGTILMRTLWQLGYAEQAQQLCQEVLVLIEQAEHTLSLVYTELYAAVLSQLCRDVAAMQAHATAAIVLATGEGSGLRVAQGRLLEGWALVMQGDVTAGMAYVQQGWTVCQDAAPQLLRPYYLSLVAEAYGQAGQPEAGLTALDEALSLLAMTGERWWEAEVWRLKGELLLRLPLPDIPQAEACVQQALDVARRQQAKALELRAALSLGRLWQRQDKRDQARQVLTEIYDWFTEGFETPDLHEARLWLQRREG